ncbi:hypothetical protein BC941DRAFT_358068, partial [Chlamydoabsidia padenii]
IDYLLSCHFDDPFCAKVENGIKLALSEFAKVVDININITYHSFCSSSCSNSTYGYGVPSSQFILPFEDGPDLNHVYPQALSKQLVRSFNASSVWSASDVTIELNHDAYMRSVDIEKALAMGWNGTGVPPTGRFWFNDTTYNNTGIGNDQVDFRYIFLHELLHGLGFLSSWAAYFWSSSSPFRRLVENAVDDELLKVITPGMHWRVEGKGGPTFITGFQSTMIFDKYLISYNDAMETPTNMSQLGFSMQNFCKEGDDQFILNFLTSFHNNTTQAVAAVQLWKAMAEPRSLLFNFSTPLVTNSSYLVNPYLKDTYHNMTLLTGAFVLNTPLEQFDQTNNRPSAAISHVDDQYGSTVDFLMTQAFIPGQSLEDITQERYQHIPVIYYNTTTSNNSIVTRTYASPIGPGILRILDSMGYSTALTNTSYLATGDQTVKFRSTCADINDNSSPKMKATETPTTSDAGYTLQSSLLLVSLWIPLLWFI